MGMNGAQVSALAKKLSAAPALLAAQAAAAVQASARTTAQAARSNAPVLTGALQESINVTGSGLHASVGTDLPYAAFVEYGTSRMAPQPFIAPAADGATATLSTALAVAGRKAILL